MFKYLIFLVLFFATIIFCSSGAYAEVLDSGPYNKYMNGEKEGVFIPKNSNNPSKSGTPIDDSSVEFYKNLILEDLQKSNVGGSGQRLGIVLKEMNSRLTDKQKAQVFNKVLKTTKVSTSKVIKEILSTKTQNTSSFVATAVLSRPELSNQILLEAIKQAPQEAVSIVSMVARYDSAAVGNLQNAIAEGSVKLPNNLLQNIQKGIAEAIDASGSENSLSDNSDGGDESGEDKESGEKKSGDNPPMRRHIIHPQRTCITISNDVICN